jgi:hypothetical protein
MDYKVVRMGERSELLVGGRYREYVRAEIMVDETGPFTIETEKSDGWQDRLRQKANDQVRNVRSFTT